MKQKTILTTLAACIALSAMAFSSVVSANILTFDPAIKSKLILTCTYPLEREDNTALRIDEIAKVTFHVKKQGEADTAYAPAGENSTACRQVYDMTQVPDGAYVYAATPIDADGRIATYSETVTAIVKRLAPPKAAGLSGAVE